MRGVDESPKYVTPLPMPELVPIPEASVRLGIHPGTGYRLVREGKFPLPVLVVGSTYRVRRAELEAFINGDAVASA